MNFSINLAEISLEHYKKEVLKKNFIPSRQILKNEADIHFTAFKKAGISTLEGLLSAISDPKAKTELLKDKNISDEYLSTLLRELKSVIPKPIKLKEFNWIPDKAINGLDSAGISNTKTLYEKLGKLKARKQFSQETGIDEKEITELLKLSDLTRIQWVNTTFARILSASGFDTVQKVSKADHKDLYHIVTAKNEEMNLYKGKIGLNDMKLCVEAAGFIDAEIEV